MLTACGIETWICPTCSVKDATVATVLTACGIETVTWSSINRFVSQSLQQCLPLAVLKRNHCWFAFSDLFCCNSAYRLRYWNITPCCLASWIANASCNSAYRLRYWNLDWWYVSTKNGRLQQCLPLAVLKLHIHNNFNICIYGRLQQCLPLAVLKLSTKFTILVTSVIVATVLTACGIETFPLQYKHMGAL